MYISKNEIMVRYRRQNFECDEAVSKPVSWHDLKWDYRMPLMNKCMYTVHYLNI